MTAPRRFFLTGCASGMGRHIAQELLKRGNRVYATDIDLEALRKYARENGWSQDLAVLRQLDVRDAQAWEKAVQEAASAFAGLDVLMNIAGVLIPGWVHEAPSQDADRHLDINAKGLIHGTMAAARLMVRQGHGHIVNIASMAALAPIPGLALYSASKYAARAFSLAAAQELKSRGVFVTVLCPDAARTPMLDVQLSHDASALSFSGPAILSVEDISKVLFDHILPHKPLEVFLPKSRGWLARLADVFPGLQARIEPLLRRKGLERQKELRARP